MFFFILNSLNHMWILYYLSVILEIYIIYVLQYLIVAHWYSCDHQRPAPQYCPVRRSVRPSVPAHPPARAMYPDFLLHWLKSDEELSGLNHNTSPGQISDVRPTLPHSHTPTRHTDRRKEEPLWCVYAGNTYKRSLCKNTHTHTHREIKTLLCVEDTHTHTYTYVRVRASVCVCVCVGAWDLIRTIIMIIVAL